MPGNRKPFNVNGLNYGNPYVRNLIFAVAPTLLVDERSASVADGEVCVPMKNLVNGSVPIIQSDNGTWETGIVPTPRGPAWVNDYNGATVSGQMGVEYVHHLDYNKPSDSDNVCMIGKFKMGTNIGANGGRIISKSNGSTGDDFCIGIFPASGVFARAGGTTIQTTGQPSDGDIVTVAGWQDALGKGIRLYDEDGVLLEEVTHPTVTTIPARTITLNLGHHVSGQRAMDLELDYCYVWHDYGNATPLVDEIVAKPYQILASTKIYVPVFVTPLVPAGPVDLPYRILPRLSGRRRVFPI